MSLAGPFLFPLTTTDIPQGPLIPADYVASAIQVNIKIGDDESPGNVTTITVSTTTNSVALIVNGIAENYATLTVFNTDDTVSPTTGAVVVDGGVGIVQSVNVADTVTIQGTVIDTGVITGVTVITGIVTPTAASDVASKAYVDSMLGGNPGTPLTSIQFNNTGIFTGSANLTWSGTSLAIIGTIIIGSTMVINGLSITNLSTPVIGSQLANKAYVDSKGFASVGAPTNSIQFNKLGVFGGSSDLLISGSGFTVNGKLTVTTGAGVAPFSVQSTTLVPNLTTASSTNSTFNSIAANVSLTNDTANTNWPVPFSNAATGNNVLKTAASVLFFNPSTGNLSVGTGDGSFVHKYFSGALNGNAAIVSSSTNANNQTTTNADALTGSKAVTMTLSNSGPQYQGLFVSPGGVFGALAYDPISTILNTTLCNSYSTNAFHVPNFSFSVYPLVYPMSAYIISISDNAGSNTYGYASLIVNYPNFNIIQHTSNITMVVDTSNSSFGQLQLTSPGSAGTITCTFSAFRIL